MSKKITIEEVQKTTELARIELTKKEEEKFTEDLDNILDFFADIQEAQSDNVEEFDHYQLNSNQLRVDEVLEKPEGLVKGIKENFPDQKDDYLKVRSVLNKSNS